MNGIQLPVAQFLVHKSPSEKTEPNKFKSDNKSIFEMAPDGENGKRNVVPDFLHCLSDTSEFQVIVKYL